MHYYRRIYLILGALIFASAFFTTCIHAQDAVMPAAEIVKDEAASPINEPAPYVKPGNVTVNFKDADIRAVLNYLAEVSGVDIVPAPDVSGTVTLKLTDKPWEVALDIIVKNYGYAYEREGDIIRVVTLDSLKLEELSTEVIPLNYATAEDAQEAVKDMLTERGKLTYDTRINVLIVTDLATNIYKIKRVIEELDRKTPQIMIEAKIIETTLGEDEKLGIDWNLVIAASGAKGPMTFPFTNWGNLYTVTDDFRKYLPFGQTDAMDTTVGLGGATTTTGTSDYTVNPGPNNAFPFVEADEFIFGTLDFSQFGAVMEYLKARSDTDIISSPRITTLNNKEAKMFVGKVYNYIAEIEEKEDTSGSERFTYNIEKEEIGIRLLVTPHINKNGDIEVKIKPEIKDIIGFQQVTEFFSLPIFTTREAETQVMVRDEDTIFIGGLIKENVTVATEKFPILGDLLGDIPFVGSAFKHQTDTLSKTELVFFLTVHVVKDTKVLTNRVMKDMSEVNVPIEIYNPADFEEAKPVRKSKVGPVFDFRKKKR